MTKPLMHKATEENCQQLIGNPTHALLVLGLSGVGKKMLAKYISRQILKVEKLENYPYFRAFDALDGGGIDKVREIKEFLSLKTTGKGQVRRIVIVSDTENLGHEAQNALLNILEEPPRDSMIILTASEKSQLLDTIVSRARELHVLPITSQQMDELAKEYNADSKAVESAKLISGGRPGLFTALLDDKRDNPLLEGIQVAKNLVTQPLYERLTRVDELIKDKTKLMFLTQSIQIVLTVGFESAISKNNQVNAKRLLNARKRALEATLALKNAANPKLTLTNLLLNI